MAIESKNLLVWVKAMSRGQALPLDASEIYDTLAAAETYAGSATAYAGQTIKAKLEDGKYHSYVLQPSEAGYVLEEVGAINESDLKQYVQVVDELPTSGQIEGVLYINDTDGYIWTGSAWKKVFWDLTSEVNKKAPINNPVFTGTVKVKVGEGEEAVDEEVALKSYVDGLISNLESKTPALLNTTEYYNTLINFKAGETYRVTEAGTYFDHDCEVGDLVIVLNDFSLDDIYGGPDDAVLSDQVLVIQANIDGAVTSAAETAKVGEIVVFDSVTGKVIKSSGVQISSLNQVITDSHTHTNKTQLATYDKTQTELLAAAKTEAEGLVAGKADKATTLGGYGITDAYNKTEIDGKLTTITDNLNTKISGADVDTKIATAKTEILEEADEAASSALEARVGAIPADTTIQSYIDTAVGSGGTASANAIATAKQEAITESKNYTDTKLTAALTVIEF